MSISPLKNKKYYVRLVIAVAILVVFLKWVKVKDYSLLLNSFKYSLFWYGCFLLVVVQLVKTLRFQILIRQYEVRVPFAKNFLIHCIVPILGLLTPSKLGEGAKTFMIEQRKEKVGFCFILEKLSDMAILCVLGLIGVFRFTIFVNSVYFLIPLLVIAAIGLVFFDRIYNLLFKRFMKHSLEKNWFLTNLRLFALEMQSYLL